MISTTARYALRAVVYLAGCEQGFQKREAIAAATLVPIDYLLKVLNQLDEADLVHSKRGPGGGYQLSHSPANMTALQVVLAVDQIPRIKECPLGMAGHTKLCPLHAMLDEASQKVEECFRSTTIADLVPGKRNSRTCRFPAVD